ncbi:Hypothetical protein Cul05146_0095 [Corynebacterium ulcerans]|nr:Hypothetical protein Cul05146_0095 [Corynebacterium ulcerans]
MSALSADRWQMLMADMAAICGCGWGNRGGESLKIFGALTGPFYCSKGWKYVFCAAIF